MENLQSKTILDDLIRYLPVINLVFIGFMYYIRVELGKMIEQKGKDTEDKIERERSWRIEDDKELKKQLDEANKKINNSCQRVGELEKVCAERHKRK